MEKEKKEKLEVIVAKQVSNHTHYIVERSDDFMRSEHLYKEFENLREKLIEKWPGIFIPGLQPKKAKAKNETNISEIRKEQLNRFCHKLGNIPYLLGSKEVRVFFNENINIPQETFEQMAIRYKTTFTEFDNNFDEDSEEVQTHFGSFFGAIKTTKSITHELLMMVTDLKQKEKNNKDMFLTTLEKLFVFEKDVLTNYINNDCEQLVLFNMNKDALTTSMVNFVKDTTNPYDSFLNQLTEDILDQNALSDAYDSLQKLKEQLAKFSKAKQKNSNNDNVINALKDIIKIATWHLDREIKNYNKFGMMNYNDEIKKMRVNFEMKNDRKDEILKSVLNDSKFM